MNVNKDKQITKEDFIELYDKHSIKELMELLGVSRTTITTYANKFNLPKKRRRKLIKE